MMSNADRITDPYEKRAYLRLLDEFDAAPSIIDRAGARTAGAIGDVGRRASAALPSSVTAGGEQAITTALAGLQRLTVDPAMRSVRRTRVLRAFEIHGHFLGSIDQIRGLELRTVDEAAPGLSWRYALAAAVEGAGAGAAITGGEVLASVGSVASAGAAADELHEDVIGKVVGAERRRGNRIVAQGVEQHGHRRRQHGVDQDLQARRRVRSMATRSASARARSLARMRSSTSSRWVAA